MRSGPGPRPALVLLAAALCAADDPPRPEAPTALACAPDGTIDLADARLPGLFRRSPDGRLDLLFRAQARNRTPLRAVRALALGRDGDLFVADSATGDVYRLRPGASPSPLTDGALEVPTGLAVRSGGDLIVSDLKLAAIFRIPGQGGKPERLADVPAPRGVAVTHSGDVIVLSAGPDQLVRLGPDGSVRPLCKGALFRFPTAVLAARDGPELYVSDTYAATVWAVPAAGEPRPLARGRPLVRPAALALDPSGALLVADPGAGQIYRMPKDGPAEPLLKRPR
jgi:sugar lactone lactonase YvrE